MLQSKIKKLNLIFMILSPRICIFLSRTK